MAFETSSNTMGLFFYEWGPTLFLVGMCTRLNMWPDTVLPLVLHCFTYTDGSNTPRCPRGQIDPVLILWREV